MITILDPRTKLPVHFPQAAAVCPHNSCPDPECDAPDGWSCVVGVVDGSPKCMGQFPPESVYSACNCPEDTCPHLDPSDSLHGPILDVLEAWHGDPVARRAQAKLAAHRQVLGLPEEPRHTPSNAERFAGLLRHAPRLQEHFTHLTGGHRDADLSQEDPHGGSGPVHGRS